MSNKKTRRKHLSLALGWAFSLCPTITASPSSLALFSFQGPFQFLIFHERPNMPIKKDLFPLNLHSLNCLLAILHVAFLFPDTNTVFLMSMHPNPTSQQIPGWEYESAQPFWGQSGSTLHGEQFFFRKFSPRK